MSKNLELLKKNNFNNMALTASKEKQLLKELGIEEDIDNSIVIDKSNKIHYLAKRGGNDSHKNSKTI